MRYQGLRITLGGSGSDSQRTYSRSLRRTRFSSQTQAEHRFQSPGNRSQQDLHDSVAVILGYYNGNNFLPAQIRSVLDQSHKNIKIFISDDCSEARLDLTPLGATSSERQNIYTRYISSNVGFANNFLDALSVVEQPFQYFAFSDQDDIWHSDKISDALEALTQYLPDLPVLYCARTVAVDERGEVELGTSPLFDKPPSFANALVQSIGGGNTMVFNKAARDLIVESSTDIDVVSHDWWCYQIVSGAGGIVHYDLKPCLKYRQHAANLVGSNNGWAERSVRIIDLLKGKFRNWNDVNLEALSKNRGLLTPDNQKRLDDFIMARQSGLFKRLFLFWRAGVYRQTLLDNIALFFGLLINKV